jgi:hypothetical protein
VRGEELIPTKTATNPQVAKERYIRYAHGVKIGVKPVHRAVVEMRQLFLELLNQAYSGERNGQRQAHEREKTVGFNADLLRQSVPVCCQVGRRTSISVYHLAGNIPVCCVLEDLNHLPFTKYQHATGREKIS